MESASAVRDGHGLGGCGHRVDKLAIGVGRAWLLCRNLTYEPRHAERVGENPPWGRRTPPAHPKADLPHQRRVPRTPCPHGFRPTSRMRTAGIEHASHARHPRSLEPRIRQDRRLGILPTDLHTSPSRSRSGRRWDTGDMDLDPAVAARLKRNDAGLVPAIAQQHDSGEVLMLGWMDDEALARTLATGRATYWSRSRGEYWVKGETSGHRQWVRAVSLDCDGDTVLLQVDQEGPACHTGTRSCFDARLGLGGRGRRCRDRRLKAAAGSRRPCSSGSPAPASTPWPAPSPGRPRTGTPGPPSSTGRGATSPWRPLSVWPGLPAGASSWSPAVWCAAWSPSWPSSWPSPWSPPRSWVGRRRSTPRATPRSTSAGLPRARTRRGGGSSPWPRAVVALAASAYAVRFVSSWPEMGSRYDAPSSRPESDDPSQMEDVDLWRAIDQGRDPTDPSSH